MDDLFRCVLDARPPDADSLTAWWAATTAIRAPFDTPVDRAIVGGAWADRLGFAFAGGYQAALQALVPEHGGIGALCVTEVKGNAPKHIETTLVPAGDHYELSGTKKWATAAPLATHLLVAATTGRDDEGRNQIRLVRVATDAAGVTLVPSSAPFVPEIPHAEVTLDKVVVHAQDLLPGDGYSEYIKPFRTVEDTHVHAALVGYLIGVARRHSFVRELVEQLVAAAVGLRGIAVADPKAPMTHFALAGSIAQIGKLVTEIERAWEVNPDDEYARWKRDRPLLGVAKAARATRRENAWASLS
ncbi:MAG: acyl-CoA dehydrogenase family protein [Kofleriaceae bacterium]